MKAIENDLAFNEFITERKISLSSYIGRDGSKNKSYMLDRDSFSYFVMGFTGKEAKLWKRDYIKAFNAMEKKLLNPVAELTPMQLMEKANQLLLIENEKKEKQLKQNEKVIASMQLIETASHNTGTTISIQEFCKIVTDVIEGTNLGRTTAYSILRSMNLVMMKSTHPTQNAMTRKLLDYIKHDYGHMTVVYSNRADDLIKWIMD